MNHHADIEVVPAILRKTLEGIQEDWVRVVSGASHIQIDVTDGIFAGDGTFRDLPQLKKLEQSEKIELHMMVQHPNDYTQHILDLAPARIVFHIEPFTGKEHALELYELFHAKLPQAQLGIALNPETPTNHIAELVHILDYVLFMGYSPGFAGQEINPVVFTKIGQFSAAHPEVAIAVDGHVGFDTAEDYAKAGATILCANSAIFKTGNPLENMEQLKLKAQSALL